jgi:predicted RNase H-like HicB family nuclease
MTMYHFTAVITREGKFYVGDCPELGVTSQGLSLEEALENLKEAVGLYLRDEDVDSLVAPKDSPLMKS